MQDIERAKGFYRDTGAVKRAARHALRGGRSFQTVTIAPEGAELTDEHWELVRPLLPQQKGGVGRTSNDHHVVLGGILWVARTGSSWREMPEEYGDFTTAYKRWKPWEQRGLWQRILQKLGWEELPGPSTKPHK